MEEDEEFQPPIPCGVPCDDGEDAPTCKREQGHTGVHITGNDWMIYD